MAEAMEDLQDHRNNLKRLCRVCGGKFKKSKEKYECSYSCIEHKEALAEKYQLNIEKDDRDIHPSHFCNACYVSLARTSAERGPIFWEIHTESCKTCFAITEKQSKGGRPRKPKKGRKPTSDKLKSPASHDSSEGLQSKIKDITQTLESHRTRDFDEKFTFTETLNTDFNCPICKDILDRPLETACEHYFCASCLLEAFENDSSNEACPVCKFPLSAPQVKPATRMILRLIGEIKVGCKRCKTQLNYEDTAHHVCPPAPHLLPPPAETAQRPLPAAPAVARAIPGLAIEPVATDPVTLQDALEELRQGKVSPQVEKLGTMFVKSKLKASSDGKSALLKTQGKPIQIVHVPRAEKSSKEVGERQLRSRTRDLQSVGDALSKGQMDIQLVQYLKTKKSKQEREEIIREALGKELILEIPDKQSLAMKADLGMSWFRLNKLRRWFKQWGIKMESEKLQRKQKKDQIGDNLEAEMVPMEHTAKKEGKIVTFIKATPCAYVDNLAEQIKTFVDENAKAELLTTHGGMIPEDQLYVKLGGDHGQGYMKFAFQLANLEKPNSSKKTVVFSLFEAKDTRNNLRTSLERYNEQLEAAVRYSSLIFLENLPGN
ncbi:hypothetical protein ACROYT_G014031 [Oculina patagonica]